MKRILQIIGTLQNGGAENMIMNYYRHIDRKRIQFDFVVHSTEKEHFHNEAEALGAKIFFVPSKKRPLKCFSGFFRLGKQYETVHLHTASALCCFELIALRIAGAKVIIGHSHNTLNITKLRNLLQPAFRPLFSTLCDYRFACSAVAGEWLFGSRAFAKYGRVIKNAIEIERFRFNAVVRERVRKQHNIGNSLLLGHVGRFVDAKNQAYLIEILDSLVETGTDAKLMLAGWGEDEDKLKALINIQGLNDKVLLMIARSDVHELLQAMDVFVLPSLYEGLAMTLIEAQTAGLPCVYSDVVPPEARISTFMQQLSIDESPIVWANAINRFAMLDLDRATGAASCEKGGYSITKAVKALEEFYLCDIREIPA